MAKKAIDSVAQLTKASIEAYAEYEQLVGGVETLFQSSAGTVQDYAANAYKTAGLSANEYMSTVTSFSASLLQSLEGDTDKAASVADMAITDMADNANKMGTSMESIQSAYQGFAKQNYNMLDNLKLGYGGTKEEMERLLADATALSGVDYDIKNLSDVYEAIHVIQTELGVTGTTAKEASSTISGSLASAKSAWENLLVGISDENANFEQLVDNFSESVSTAAENILPRIEVALSGIGDLIANLSPIIVEALPSLVENVLPSIFDSAIDLVMGLVDGIISALPKLIPAVVQVILTISEKLTEPSMIMRLIQAAFQLLSALAQGLINAIPQIVSAVPTIIMNLVETILRFLPQLAMSGLQLIGELALGIAKGAVDVMAAVWDICTSIGDGFRERLADAREWGRDMILNFINGIGDRISALWDSMKNIAQGIRNFLGFSEPKEGPLSNFHTYAPDMMELFAKGVKDNEDMLYNTVADAFDFGSVTVNSAKSIGGDGSAQGGGGSSVPIIVQCVLDGQIVSENTTYWQRKEARAYG